MVLVVEEELGLEIQNHNLDMLLQLEETMVEAKVVDFRGMEQDGLIVHLQIKELIPKVPVVEAEVTI
jgi:hypothetical protein